MQDNNLYRSLQHSKTPNQLSTLSEEQRVMLSADDVFTMYLVHVASLVNQDYYRTVLQFVLLYRECFNQYGWQKLAEAELRDLKQPLDDLHVQQRIVLKAEIMQKFEFSECQNAECIPEICNEFVSIYMVQ